jgi:hypothetical protein
MMSLRLQLLIPIAILCSCESNKDHEATYKMLNQSIEFSNSVIAAENVEIYENFNDDLRDIMTWNRGVYWLPRMDSLKQIAKSTYDFISNIKGELEDGNGVTWSGSQNHYGEGSKEVEQFFIDNGNGLAVYKSLKHFWQRLVVIDSNVSKQFMKAHTFPLEITNGDRDGFVNKYFNGLTFIAAIAMLSKLQNHIKLAENEYARTCAEWCRPMICGYNKFSAIIGQSSNVLGPKDTLEVKAGIGEFTTSNHPSFSIGGKLIKPDELDCAIYRMKVPDIPGRYSLPVIIGYIDQDGMKQQIVQDIRYEVIKK